MYERINTQVNEQPNERTNDALKSMTFTTFETFELATSSVWNAVLLRTHDPCDHCPQFTKILTHTSLLSGASPNILSVINQSAQVSKERQKDVNSSTYASEREKLGTAALFSNKLL